MPLTAAGTGELEGTIYAYLPFQVMGNAMALAAFRVLLQYGLRMRSRVAIHAFQYGLMFVWVALRAGNLVMLKLTLVKEVNGLLMTGPAVMSGGVLGISDHRGHVDRMAGQAGLKFHVLCMLFVAIHAVWNQPVGCVTFVAGHVRVGTWRLLYLVTLLLVTGEAWATNGAFQLQIKGSMGIGVTTPATGQFIMGLPAMTHAALWDGSRTFRRVFRMAVLAADLCLVFGASFRYGLWLHRVAHRAVGIGHLRSRYLHLNLRLLGRCGRGPKACPLFTTKGANQSDHSSNTNDNTH